MPEPPEGDRDGLSPGLSLPDPDEADVAGGERLLVRAVFDVFLCSAAIRSERLAPALGTGTPLSLDMMGTTLRGERRASRCENVL